MRQWGYRSEETQTPSLQGFGQLGQQACKKQMGPRGNNCKKWRKQKRKQGSGKGGKDPSKMLGVPLDNWKGGISGIKSWVTTKA